ncbi:MAG: M16 family metallopeptidase [Acidobacteriota bacterium]
MSAAPPLRVTVPPVRRQRLANGMMLLHIEDHRLPTIAVHLQVAGGGCMDPGGREGLASLTGALLGKGSERFDRQTLAEKIDDLGLSWSARGGWDGISVTLAGLSEDLTAIVDLLGEIALRPAFDPAEVDVMRSRRLSGLARGMDDPSTLADWAFAMQVFADHPYGHPLSGTPTSIASISRDDIAEFHRSTVRPQSAILAVAGDAAPDEVDAAAAAVLGDWPGDGEKTALPEAALPSAPPGCRVLLVDRPDLSQAQIRWGHPGITRDDEAHDACEVMNWILGGGGFSSRMIERIRAEKGLTYGVHSTFDARRLGGAFRVSTFTPNESVAEVTTEIHSLVDAYRQDGPTEAEVAAARARFIGGYPLEFETALQVASRYLELESFDLPTNSLDTYQDRVEKMTRDQLATLAAQTLHPSTATVVIVGRADTYAATLGDIATVERIDYRDLMGPCPGPSDDPATGCRQAASFFRRRAD